jgi:type II secretion system protein I
MRLHKPNGFTLIESVAALAVASIALLALLQLQLVSIHTADKAQGLTQAVLLAQEKIAETLSGGYPAVGVKSGAVEADGDQLAWQMEVTDARLPQWASANASRPSGQPALGRDRLRQLTVDVTWQKGPGPKHITLTTFVAENASREG